MKMRTPSLFKTIKDTVVTTATNAVHIIEEKAHSAKEAIDIKIAKVKIAMHKAQLRADRKRKFDANAELVTLKKEIVQLEQNIQEKT